MADSEAEYWRREYGLELPTGAPERAKLRASSMTPEERRARIAELRRVGRRAVEVEAKALRAGEE